MTTNFLIGILHWRDHAGPLNASHAHPQANLGTLLWGCNRWLETNPGAANTADGQRVVEIKREIEDWLEGQPPSNCTG